MQKNETFERIYAVIYFGIFGLAIFLSGWIGR